MRTLAALLAFVVAIPGSWAGFVAKGARVGAFGVAQGQAFPLDKVEKMPVLGGGDGGEQLKLGGHVTVLVFWASWCPYCKKQLAALSELKAKFGPRGVEFVGINKEENRLNAKAAAMHLPFPSVYDEQERFSSELGVNAIPVTVVLDKQGKLVRHSVGYVAETEALLSSLFERLL